MTEAAWPGIVGPDDGYELSAPASESDLERAEVTLGVRLPDQLRELYQSTDGIFDAPGQWHVIWPLARLTAANVDAYRTEGSPRDQYVGFGDDGTGNPFCVRRIGGDEVLYWNPIDAEAIRLADDLGTFWSRMNEGTLPAH